MAWLAICAAIIHFSQSKLETLPAGARITEEGDVRVTEEGGVRVVLGGAGGEGRLKANITAVVKFLAPFKERLEKVAVESPYDWYWLVDGLCSIELSSAPAGAT